jgi:hypothetical protein
MSEMLSPWEVAKLTDVVKEKLRRQAVKSNTDMLPDWIQDLNLFILMSVDSYKGKPGQLCNYLCNRLSKFVFQEPYYNITEKLLSEYIFLPNTLTCDSVEAMIDMKRLSAWDQYLLWQHHIEGLSTRQIARLTGYGKSLIAQDLKDLTHEHTI